MVGAPRPPQIRMVRHLETSKTVLDRAATGLGHADVYNEIVFLSYISRPGCVRQYRYQSFHLYSSKSLDRATRSDIIGHVNDAQLGLSVALPVVDGEISGDMQVLAAAGQ